MASAARELSYLAAENGGAAFVILYVAITLVVGLPVLLAELVIGRGAQQSSVRALHHFGGPAWRPLGMLFVAAGFVILSYYAVIAGWTIRYAFIVLSSGFGAEVADRFGDIATGWDAFGYHVLFMIVTVWIVAGGVKGGIERTAMALMPTLLLIVAGLAVYAATLEGAGPGYTYYLSVDVSKLMHWSVLKDAAGQAFFSLSLGMGAMLTFASYLRRDQNLPNESLTIAGADVGIAFLAGLVVFPLIFALGLEARVSESTVGALFITLPHRSSSLRWWWAPSPRQSRCSRSWSPRRSTAWAGRASRPHCSAGPPSRCSARPARGARRCWAWWINSRTISCSWAEASRSRSSWDGAWKIPWRRCAPAPPACAGSSYGVRCCASPCRPSSSWCSGTPCPRRTQPSPSCSRPEPRASRAGIHGRRFTKLGRAG
jgi:hypothetical protein